MRLVRRTRDELAGPEVDKRIAHPGAVGHLVEKARKTHVDALGRHKRDDSEKKQRKPHAKLKKVSRARNAG